MMQEHSGAVSALYRYPVKSLQGLPESRLRIEPEGVVGDRQWGLFDVATERLASAKRFRILLEATGHDDSVELPDGTRVVLADPAASEQLTAWLGRETRLIRAAETGSLAYQMTFDPPNDDAEMYDIPTPEGSFVDLAPVHLVTTSTLDACSRRWPDLDWDVRRFRPNILADIDSEPFAENDWVGRDLGLGQVVLRASQATVRCAIPLRAQPGLARQPEMFAALNEANPAAPNHLGLYLTVTRPGEVHLGDRITLPGASAAA